MRYAFIERHRTEWPIVIQCEVLRVSRSGFYSWRKRPPSATATRRAALTQEVREVHRISRETYGAVRVHQALGQRGTKCDRKTVTKVMREAGIRSKTSRKFRVTTTDSNHPHPVAQNVLARDFTADKANQKWVADITYIATLEGWLYLAAVIDLFTRKVVGWSMSERIDSRLAVDALEMAVTNGMTFCSKNSEPAARAVEAGKHSTMPKARRAQNTMVFIADFEMVFIDLLPNRLPVG